MTKPKPVRTKRELLASPYVYEVHRDSDGWWAYLVDGYKSIRMDCGTLHEQTISELCDAYNDGIVKIAN